MSQSIEFSSVTISKDRVELAISKDKITQYWQYWHFFFHIISLRDYHEHMFSNIPGLYLLVTNTILCHRQALQSKVSPDIVHAPRKKNNLG